MLLCSHRVGISLTKPSLRWIVIPTLRKQQLIEATAKTTSTQKSRPSETDNRKTQNHEKTEICGHQTTKTTFDYRRYTFLAACKKKKEKKSDKAIVAWRQNKTLWATGGWTPKGGRQQRKLKDVARCWGLWYNDRISWISVGLQRNGFVACIDLPHFHAIDRLWQLS